MTIWSSPFWVRAIIVAIGFPVVALMIHTPLWAAAVLLQPVFSRIGGFGNVLGWLILGVTEIATFGGALLFCWWVWPKTQGRSN
jgi:hypothetical protein